MPLYSWTCGCGHTQDVYAKLKDYKRAPKHCGKPMEREITGSHYVWGSFTPYRAVGRGRPWIKTRQEHKDYLRQNGYEEVGNDSSIAPPELGMCEGEIAERVANKRKEEAAAMEQLVHTSE